MERGKEELTGAGLSDPVIRAFQIYMAALASGRTARHARSAVAALAEQPLGKAHGQQHGLERKSQCEP
jgi:hypothetical protein